MPKCSFKLLTGLSCPGCGLQRAVHALLNGEPMKAIQYNYFLVYSGPTVLLLMDGKEVYRGAQFIDLEELRFNINRYIEPLDQ